MTSVARLLVRRLGEELIDSLKARAAANRHSGEEEHRHALRAPKRGSFAEVLSAIPNVGDDADFVRVEGAWCI